MKIRINGEEKIIDTHKKNLTLAETLDFMGYKANTIVVELNNLIINSDHWKYKKIQDGDKLEIVTIVGGG